MDCYLINNVLEKIEDDILIHSFNRELTLCELGVIYKTLLEVRTDFLNFSFNIYASDEVEQLRYRIQENIYMIIIYIKEKKGLNVNSEMEKLKVLCEGKMREGERFE